MKNRIRISLSKDDAIFIKYALELVTTMPNASKDAKSNAWKLQVRIAENLLL